MVDGGDAGGGFRSLHEPQKMIPRFSGEHQDATGNFRFRRAGIPFVNMYLGLPGKETGDAGMITVGDEMNTGLPVGFLKALARYTADHIPETPGGANTPTASGFIMSRGKVNSFQLASTRALILPLNSFLNNLTARIPP